MQKPMRIVVNDHGVLTLPAYAILDNMLNVPERDYRTFEEMCSFFPKDEPSTVRNALTELKDEKYVNGSAVNLNAHKIKSVNSNCIDCSYC